MGKRRKTEQGTNQALFDLKKLPNVLPDTVALACQRDRKYTFACKFKNRLSIPLAPNVLDAIVLQNDICVLISKLPIVDVKTVEFCASLSTDGVSGRQKKGALKLKAGAIICSISYSDGRVVEFSTPVGGKLLELNELVCDQPALLSEKFDSEGYLAVIYPDGEIPSLDGYPDYKSLAESISQKHVEKGVCFDFQEGNCSRGDSCRFKHKLSDPKKVVNAVVGFENQFL